MEKVNQIAERYKKGFVTPNQLAKYKELSVITEAEYDAIIHPDGASIYGELVSAVNILMGTPETSTRAVGETIVDSATVMRAKYVLCAEMAPDTAAASMPELFDQWNPNGKAYKKGDPQAGKPNSKVLYKGKLYKCLKDHESQEGWTPDTSPSLWVEISDPAIEWPDWKQPSHAEDAYAVGAKVTYQGKKYISNINANTTVPGSDERWWKEVKE